MNVTHWLIDKVAALWSTDVDDPVVPVVAVDPALRIIGTLFDTAIESKLTGPFIDKQLLWLKGAINSPIAWALIGPVVAPFIVGGKVSDLRAMFDAAFTVLQTSVAALNPVAGKVAAVVHGAIDFVWDRLASKALAKLQAKGLA